MANTGQQLLENVYSAHITTGCNIPIIKNVNTPNIIPVKFTPTPSFYQMFMIVLTSIIALCFLR